MIDKLYLKDCSIVNNVLKIHVTCDMNHDPDVFEPKLKIYFDIAEEKLLLPVPQKKRSYFSFKNEDYMEFYHKLNIEDLFPSKKWNNIKISMFLVYGNEKIDDIILDSNLEPIKSNSKYHLEFNNDSYIYLKKSKTFGNNKYMVKLFFSYIIRIISLAISIILIPFFILDSIFIMAKIPNLSSSGGKIYLTDPNPIKRGMRHILWRISRFSNLEIEGSTIKFKNKLIDLGYNLIRKFTRKENRVLFISERDLKLTGNLKFIQEKLQEHEGLITEISTCNQSFPTASFKHRIWTYIKMAQADVILLDAYFSKMNYFTLKDQKLIQVWHAAGAFKTFGFSRLGKPGTPKLKDTANRKYDKVTVSSSNVINCYAEAFGISSGKVSPLGIPRTDVFFDKEYENKAKDKFYSKYPHLKDKKIILFAPTYRGRNRRTSYYPIDAFNPVEICNQLDEDYVILMKHHFFVDEHFKVPKEYSDKIIDIDITEDINDLFFITDILITDYSSIVFEASLLDIPMLFYVFDLETYISERSFYFEYKNFVPGKITYNQDELIESIKNKDFEESKIKDFKDKFFEYKDGKSTERVVEYILNCLDKNS